MYILGTAYNNAWKMAVGDDMFTLSIQPIIHRSLRTTTEWWSHIYIVKPRSDERLRICIATHRNNDSAFTEPTMLQALYVWH